MDNANNEGKLYMFSFRERFKLNFANYVKYAFSCTSDKKIKRMRKLLEKGGNKLDNTMDIHKFILNEKLLTVLLSLRLTSKFEETLARQQLKANVI